MHYQTGGWEGSQTTFGSDSENLRLEKSEPEGLLVGPMHPLDKPCLRAMVPVSPGEPEEWVVAPDLPEQKPDGFDKQKEQDAIVS